MSTSSFSQGLALPAPLFAALGDEIRLSLVTRLCQRSWQSLTQLAEGLLVTRQAVTKHLQVLERVGLVHSRRQGRETLFALDAKPIATMTEYLDLVSLQWEKKLDDLRDFLDE